MAARRLIIVLVLLLSASVIAAALAPDRTGPGATEDEETTSSSPTSTTSTTTSAGDPTAGGDSFSVRIDASAQDPETVEGDLGDQLALNVGSSQPRTIELEPLGLAEFAGPDAPAHFNILLRNPGTIPITDADDGEILGRLVVAEPKGG